MKKLILSFAIVTALAVPSFASDEHSEKQHHEGPCRKLHEAAESACEAAGYKMKMHGKKDYKDGNHGLYVDCITPIMREGKAPADVKLDSGLIQACKQRIAERKNKSSEAN